MLELQEYNGKSVLVEGAVVTSLVPFHTQGGRESCPGGGCERVLILGGPLSSNANSSQHRLPFHGTTQRVPCLGALLLKLGASMREGGWNEGGTCPQSAAHSGNTVKSAKG